MIAKQTARSAVVAVVLAGSSVIAIADPDDGASPVADPADDAENPETSETPENTLPPGETEPAPADLPKLPPSGEPSPQGPGVRADADTGRSHSARAPTGRFQIGVGIGPDDPFIATATVAQDNLFGTGKQLSLSARLSQRRQLALMRFVDPSVLGSGLSLSADVYNDRRLLPGLTRNGSGATVTLSHPLGEHLRGFVGYRAEHVTVDANDMALARTVEGLPPLGGGMISAVRAGLAYDDVDSLAWPRRGTRAGLMVEHADRRLGSDYELDRISGYLAHHQPLGPFTLHLGFTGEALHANDPLGVPRSERLFLDGSSDIRGFRPGALSPYGGDLKFTGTGALEVPLIRSIGLSAEGFVDVGGIYDRDGRGMTGHSFGFGLVWHSPIGTLRFDWAFPSDGGKPGFLFGLGTDF